ERLRHRLLPEEHLGPPSPERVDGAVEIADLDELERLAPALRSRMNGRHEMRARAAAADRITAAAHGGDGTQARRRGDVDAPDERRLRVEAHDAEAPAVRDRGDGALGQEQRDVELAGVEGFRHRAGAAGEIAPVEL